MSKSVQHGFRMIEKRKIRKDGEEKEEVKEKIERIDRRKEKKSDEVFKKKQEG